MKASARKSKGEYKPIIVHDNGRTEVVGKRGVTEYWVALTNCGETYRPRRGSTFPNREDAVSCAQRRINDLIEFRNERTRQYDELQERYDKQRNEK